MSPKPLDCKTSPRKAQLAGHSFRGRNAPHCRCLSRTENVLEAARRALLFHKQKSDGCWEQPTDIPLFLTHSPHWLMPKDGAGRQPALPGHSVSTAALRGVRHHQSCQKGCSSAGSPVLAPQGCLMPLCACPALLSQHPVCSLVAGTTPARMVTA